MLSNEERKANKQQKKDERRKLRYPQKFYKPFTWVPPEFEKTIDKKGREQIRIKKHGYLKLTHEVGTVIESGTKQYKVSATGALVRMDMEKTRAERRAEKNK